MDSAASLIGDVRRIKAARLTRDETEFSRMRYSHAQLRLRTGQS
jgi:hypothetical protein